MDRLRPGLCMCVDVCVVVAVQMTEENTQWLDRVAKLTKAQYDLEDQLNTTTKNVHVSDSMCMCMCGALSCRYGVRCFLRVLCFFLS